MSAFLVKDAPVGLHRWLRSEAELNRRSVSQQILVCLEWCMQTYGAPKRHHPFANAESSPDETDSRMRFPRGRELAERLTALDAVDDKTANQMKRASRQLRKSKGRVHDFACFA